MNKQRRKEIEKFAEEVNEKVSELSGIIDAEQEYLDNMPENLQESERYQRTEEGIDELNDILDEYTSLYDRLIDFVQEY